MKKVIALILISLLIPIPSASANGSSYQFLTPILTTTYELPAQSQNSRWDKIEIPFSVVLVSDGTVSSFGFRLIDAEGYKLDDFNLDTGYSVDSMYLPKTTTRNTKWNLYQFQKAKLPIKLQTEIYFWHGTGKTSIIQNFPMNFVTHKDDILEKTQRDAEAKAEAEKVANAIAEAEARSVANAKAERERIEKIKADRIAQEEADADARLAEIVRLETEQVKKDLINKTCKRLGSKKLIGNKKFICKKIGTKLVWR